MKKPIYYSQKDPRWGSKPYTITGDKKQTIAASGCGPTSMAMILAEWINPKITPAVSAELAIDFKDRTADNGTEWEYFNHVAAKYGLLFRQSGYTQDAVKALQESALVICSMGPGYFTKGGHYILAYAVENGCILVNDPASTERIKASVITFQQQCKQYFIFMKGGSLKMPMTFEEALEVIAAKTGKDGKSGIDKAYWKARKEIDPYFDDLMIKIAIAVKG